ncbi:WPP domain-interacting protein 1 [Abeliophyllum distichum]|uniref:WPP domain-interacting protein 1 n=1 Tax=Abeliophyllum distichum TaxID=126358 RepID=A0ABD1QJH1_9LAMI
MELESESWALAPLEDNEAITTISSSERTSNGDEMKVQNNGYCVVENNELSFGKGIEVIESANLPLVDVQQEVSTVPEVRKERVLKKWRRIKREVNKDADNSVDTGRMTALGLSDSESNSSKRMQFFAERTQNSEGSVSPVNAVERSSTDFVVLGDSGLVIGPTFAAGMDSQNCKDQISKLSTASRAPKIRYEIPVAGVLLDKSRTRSSSGKNLGNSVQHGQKGNVRVENSKKARGKQVKIEKENSHSSLESDSQSSNFVFMQGNDSATSNGIQSGRSLDYGGGNGDELHAGEWQVYERNSEGGFEDVSQEDLVADSSWEVRGERNENHGSTVLDPLVESIYTLQSAQEALEKEVLKFREVGILDVSVHGAVPDLPLEFTSIDLKLQETRSSKQLQSGQNMRSSSHSLHSEVKEVANRKYTVTELEDLFKLKIEAEVEYLTIARTVQKLRVAAVDQITLLEEETTLASEQAQMLNMLENTENKASVLKKEAEKLVKSCEDIASADEALKMQMRICKYTSFFLVQLIMLVIILGFLIFHISPNYAGMVPT